MKEKLYRQKWLGYALAFLIPAFVIVAIMVYLKITPFGDNSVLIWDAKLQHKDYYGYLWDVLHGNSSIQYSAGKSLGGRMLGIIGFYISSPLNLLLLFFKKTQITEFMALLIVLKVGLCGLTGHVYLKKRFQISFLPAICFSTSFALMEYNILYCRNIMWLDGAIMLPLVALGVWKLISEKKHSFLWISVAIAIISNWYTGYMVCLFSAFLFVFEYLLYCDFHIFKEVKKTLKCLLRYIVTMLGGVMTSMILLLPALLSLVSGKATHNFAGLTGEINLDFLHFFSAFDISAAGNSQDAPVIYCGAMLIFFVVYYFCDSENSVKKRILSGLFLIFMVASFCLRDVELIWTAYIRSTSYYFRFSFLFVFLCMIFAAGAVANIQKKRNKKRTILWSLIIIGFGGLILEYFGELPSKNILLMLMYGILLYVFYQKSVKKKYLCSCAGVLAFLLLVAELSYNTKLAFQNYKESNETYVEYTAAMENVLDEIGTEEDNFYRLEKTYSYLTTTGRYIATCESLFFGYNSIEHYSSSYDDEVDAFLAKIGYSDWISGEAFLCETYWNSPMIVTDSILSVKYAIMDSESYGYEEYNTQAQLADDSYNVYVNQYSLPLGYNVSTDSEEEIGYTDNPYLNQELFISEIIGEEVDLYNEVLGSCTSDENSESETWTFKAESDGPVYLYVDGEDVHGNYYADNCELYVNGEFVQKICKRFLINSIYIGEYEAGSEIQIEIKHLNSDLDRHTLYMVQLDTDVFEECISVLKAGSESSLNIDGNVIEGIYSTSEDSMVMLTIPYEDAWKAYVDGEEVEIKEILGTFIGIELDAGEHEIYMEYTTPGYSIGCIFTAAGIVLFVILVVYERRRKKE